VSKNSLIQVSQQSFEVKLDYQLSLTQLYERIPSIQGSESRISEFVSEYDLAQRDNKKSLEVQIYHLAECVKPLGSNSPLRRAEDLIKSEYPHVKPSGLRALLSFAYYFHTKVERPIFALLATMSFQDPQADWNAPVAWETAYVERDSTGNTFFDSLISEPGISYRSEVDGQGKVHKTLLSPQFLVEL
jgi:hypothetical protein